MIRKQEDINQEPAWFNYITEEIFTVFNLNKISLYTSVSKDTYRGIKTSQVMQKPTFPSFRNLQVDPNSSLCR